MADSEWFYLGEAGQQEGPVSTPELIDLLRSRLPPDTLVWRDGLAGWTPGSEVPEIRVRRPPSVPAPPWAPALPAPPAEDEPRTLNLFRLLGACLRPAGRFSRAEYAIVYFGPIVPMVALVFLVALVAAAVDASENTMDIVIGLLTLCWLPVVLLSQVGGGIRRLHDLGMSGWFVLLIFVPCVNAAILLYMFLAPGVQKGQ